ncbi:MAG: 50S ribosomal protein L24 [Pseudomonadota bacterium]
MQPKLKIRKGDEVIVIAGKDIGKKGDVLKVFPTMNKVLVSGVNKIHKHTKPSALNPKGGIVVKEAGLDVSNVQHVDPASGKPTRVGFKVLKDGKKVRYAKKSGEVIDKA